MCSLNTPAKVRHHPTDISLKDRAVANPETMLQHHIPMHLWEMLEINTLPIPLHSLVNQPSTNQPHPGQTCTNVKALPT